MKEQYKEIISLTQRLIKFQSTEDRQHDLQNVVDFCADYFDNTDLFVKKYIHQGKPSVVISTHSGLEFDVLLSGHLDVVGASQDAFIPRIEKGILFGRGALDMKGPDSAMMVALQQSHKLFPQHRVALLLTTDEEIGGAYGAGYLVNNVGYRGKVVVLPDGGDDDRLIILQKGVLRFKLESYGVSAHSSRPWLGQSAIDAMMMCYMDLQKYFPHPTQENDWKPSINLGFIKSGQAVNNIPDYCLAGLDLRYTEERSSQEWIEIVTDLCQKYQVKCTVEIMGDLCCTDSSDAYLQQFKQSVETILNREVSFGLETGSSDARYFSSVGMPVIINRPVGGNIHNGGEYIDIKSLYNYYEVLIDFLGKISFDTK